MIRAQSWRVCSARIVFGEDQPPACSLTSRRARATGLRSLRQSPICLAQAPVAQLDRALPSEGRGHRFEFCRVRHSFSMTCLLAMPGIQHNRFHRWAEQRVWDALLEMLMELGYTHDWQYMIGSTTVRDHPHAAGAAGRDAFDRRRFDAQGHFTSRLKRCNDLSCCFVALSRRKGHANFPQSALIPLQRQQWDRDQAPVAIGSLVPHRLASSYSLSA